MKLIQKHFLKGIREFEIVDDVVNVYIKKLFKEEKFSIELSILNPEPLIKNSCLEFYGRVKCGTLLSLFLDKPNPVEFNTFVATLKERALAEYNVFAGLKSAVQSPVLAANSHEEPPEFEELDLKRKVSKSLTIDVAMIDETIKMIETYIQGDDIQALINALKGLKEEPENNTKIIEVINVFNHLGAQQGAVLTYAPYINTLMSDDPFGNY